MTRCSLAFAISLTALGQTIDLHRPQANAPVPVVLAISADGLFLTAHGYAVASVACGGIEDCKGALRWLRDNARANGLNADRMAVMGGYLAALLGTTEPGIGAVVDLSEPAPLDYIGRDDPPFLILHDDRILHDALRAKGVESTIDTESEAAIVAFLDRHLKSPVRRDGWVDPNLSEPAGTKYQTFYSPRIEAEASYLVWLPPGYEQDRARRYPVIYYLHGRGGSQRSGTDFLSVVDRMPPVIVVLPNGLNDGYWVDSFSGHEPIERVMLDLIRHVDRTYRTFAAPEARAVEGVSMGGFGAAHFGFKFPEWFAGMTSMAGALHDAEGFRLYASPPVWDEVFGADPDYADANAPWQLTQRNADAIRGRVQVRLIIGYQDSLIGRNFAFSNWLRDLGIDHEFTIVPGIGHSGSQLYAATGDATAAFYTRLFENVGRRPAVSAASYRGPQVAPDSLVSVFGRDLDAASVRVGDSAARVLYASPSQVNFVMPATVPIGPAEVRVTNGGGIVSLFAADIVPVAPGLFSSYYVTDGILTLFGTGIRGRSTLDAVRATIAGRDCEVLYAGPQSEYAGLDQVNIRLNGPPGDVFITVDGLPSNTIRMDGGL